MMIIIIAHIYIYIRWLCKINKLKVIETHCAKRCPIKIRFFFLRNGFVEYDNIFSVDVIVCELSFHFEYGLDIFII